MAAGPVLPFLVSGLNRNTFFLELLLEQRYTELNPLPPSTQPACLITISMCACSLKQKGDSDSVTCNAVLLMDYGSGFTDHRMHTSKTFAQVSHSHPIGPKHNAVE